MLTGTIFVRENYNEIMKVNLYLTTFLLAFGLTACQDKIAEDMDQNKTEAPSNEEQGEKDLVEIWNTEMAIDPKDDFARGVKITFDERNTSTAETPLFRPRMLFTEETHLPAIVILRHNKDGKETFLRIPGFARVTQVLDGGRKAKFKISASAGEVKRVVVATGKRIFVEGEDWHGMVILNAEQRPSDTYSKEAVFGENPEEKAKANLSDGTSLLDRVKYLGSQNAGGSLSKGSHIITASWFRRGRALRNTELIGGYDIPLISEWVKLDVRSEAGTTEKDKHILFRIAYNVGTNSKTKKTIDQPLHVKPQGMLMTYNLAVDVHQGIDMRRAGIVSNAVDFQGKYLLTDDALKKAFAKKDQSGNAGYGIPEWVGEPADAQRLQKLQMYTPVKQDDPGMFRVRDKHEFYPWNMPIMADAFTESSFSAPNYMTKMTGTMTDASVAMGLMFAQKQPLMHRPEYVTGELIGATPHSPNAWYSRPDNEKWGHNNFPNYAYYVQWAMPRSGKRLPAANQRFTYFWVDAHGPNSVNDYYKTPLAADDNGFIPDEKPAEYLKFLEPNVRTQPMVVVHQTNADFSNQVGKTPHIYATLTTDLMITEVMHLDVDGQNYSVVEIHNPTMREIDLSKYLLYRMRIDENQGGQVKLVGSFFKKKEVSLDLSQLSIPYAANVEGLSLSVLGLPSYGQNADHIGGVVDPYKPDEKTIDFNPKSFKDPTDNQRPRVYEDLAAQNKGSRKVRSIGTQRRPMIGEGQSVLIGAGGYQGAAEAQKIVSDLFPKSKYDTYYDKQHRFRHFTWNTSIPMRQKPTEGFILVRIYTDGTDGNGQPKHGDLKIVDTTIPLPGITTNNFGFAGTLEGYKAAYAKLSNKNFYVQRRVPGVVFPFMPPYRTTRVNNGAWADDWTLESGTITTNPSNSNLKDYKINHTLGYREMPFIFGDQGASTTNLQVFRSRYFRLDKTPLDPNCNQCQKGHRPDHR